MNVNFSVALCDHGEKVWSVTYCICTNKLCAQLIGIFIIRPDANSQESYAESRDDIKRTVMNGDEAPQE